jgi:hypothetical protein
LCVSLPLPSKWQDGIHDAPGEVLDSNASSSKFQLLDLFARVDRLGGAAVERKLRFVRDGEALPIVALGLLEGGAHDGIADE